MNSSVRLSEESRRKLVAWDLSSRAIRDVFEGLDALGENPTRHLVRVGPPYDVLQFDLVVREGERPGVLYTFTVKYAADEETLVVTDCDRMFEDA